MTALAYLLPALLLLLALLARRYPGERVLVRWIARRRRRRQRATVAVTTHGRPRALLPRGGRLLAWALAVRPPPPAGCSTA